MSTELTGQSASAHDRPAPTLRLVQSADAPLSPEQQQLVLDVRSDVQHVVRQLAPNATEQDQADLAGRAFVAASRSAALFDPETGARFKSYAMPAIAGKILDALVRQHRDRRFLRSANAAARRFLSEEPENPHLIQDDCAQSMARIDVLAGQFVTSLAIGAVAAQMDPEQALVETDALGTAVGVVYEVVARMDEADRRLFSLRFEQGLEQKEIMAELGMSERTVRRHLCDLLDRLREALSERGHGEPPWRR
jgi:RNA polymerase sigma factor (sigma-70 family)